jgi:formylglycine-generating enzyme required for sulfatase activity
MKKAFKNKVHRVLRGGSYFNDSRNLRAARRVRYAPEDRYWSSGFRLIARIKK